MAEHKKLKIFGTSRLLCTALIVLSNVIASDPSQAGLVDFLLGNAVHKTATLMPGRDGPLAPASDTGFAGCAQLFPKNKAIDVNKVNKQWRPVGLCSDHFAVLYSGLSKTPLVVVEKLNSSLLAQAQGEERSNQFYPDPRLAPGERAELSDYVRSCPDRKTSCYDRGHMANAADQPNGQSMIQSFALSNMVPQDPGNNRKGGWIKAEKDTRKYIKRAAGDVYVFSGPLFRDRVLATIGSNQVWVPSHLFKLVYDASSGRSWAYIMTNGDMQLSAPVDYAEFVRQTGWHLLN